MGIFTDTKEDFDQTNKRYVLLFLMQRSSSLRPNKVNWAEEEKLENEVLRRTRKKKLNFSKWCSLFFVFFATHACPHPQPLTSTLAAPPASHFLPRTHPLYISITPAIMSEEKDGASGSIFVRPFLDFR